MRKTLGRGAIYLAVSSIILMLAGYIVNIFLGRVLGPGTYGTYGIIISLMTAGNLMQTAGLPQAISKFIAEDESKSDAVLKSGLMIQIIATTFLTLVFFLLAQPLALLFHDEKLIPYIKFTSLIFPLYGLFALYTGYYNGLHNFKRQSFLNIIYAIIKVVSILIFVSLFHLFGVILGFIISPIFALLFGWRIPKNGIARFPYKKLIFFSLPLVGFAIFANLLQSIDLFFIKGLLHSDKETGFYTASQNIAEIPFYAVATLASVLFPSISRHVSQNLTSEIKKLISKSLRFSLIILMPSILLLSATSLQVLRLLYSNAYSQGSEALAILAIGNGFFTVFVILTTIISGSGSPIKSSLLAGIGVIISSLLCLLLIPSFTLTGAAIATTIASCIVMIGAALIVYRKFSILVSPKSTGNILLASLITYIIARIFTFPLILIPMYYFILFIIYGGLLWLMKEITQEDITMIKSLLPHWIIKKGKI